ncbi:hypothetical protein C8J57DRAFT_1223136 [Mycena rebaudengoi]|nr:hypothetical protein C8J57DRAFT_1223136 [Mycena rebaudengoi]
MAIETVTTNLGSGWAPSRAHGGQKYSSPQQIFLACSRVLKNRSATWRAYTTTPTATIRLNPTRSLQRDYLTLTQPARHGLGVNYLHSSLPHLPAGVVGKRVNELRGLCNGHALAILRCSWTIHVSRNDIHIRKRKTLLEMSVKLAAVKENFQRGSWLCRGYTVLKRGTNRSRAWCMLFQVLLETVRHDHSLRPPVRAPHDYARTSAPREMGLPCGHRRPPSAKCMLDERRREVPAGRILAVELQTRREPEQDGPGMPSSPPNLFSLDPTRRGSIIGSLAAYTPISPQDATTGFCRQPDSDALLSRARLS